VRHARPCIPARADLGMAASPSSTSTATTSRRMARSRRGRAVVTDRAVLRVDSVTEATIMLGDRRVPAHHRCLLERRPATGRHGSRRRRHAGGGVADAGVLRASGRWRMRQPGRGDLQRPGPRHHRTGPSSGCCPSARCPLQDPDAACRRLTAASTTGIVWRRDRQRIAATPTSTPRASSPSSSTAPTAGRPLRAPVEHDGLARLDRVDGAQRPSACPRDAPARSSR